MPFVSPLSRSYLLALCLVTCPLASGAARGQHARALDEIPAIPTGQSGVALRGDGCVPSPLAESLPGIAPSRKAFLSSSVSALPGSTTIIEAARIARAPVQNNVDGFRPLGGIAVSNVATTGATS